MQATAIGVDPRNQSHAAVVLDADEGRIADEVRVVAQRHLRGARPIKNACELRSSPQVVGSGGQRNTSAYFADGVITPASGEAAAMKPAHNGTPLRLRGMC